MSDEFELIIEGRPEDSGYVRVSDFLAEIQAFVGTLNVADRLETGAKSPSFYLRVVGLSLKSPPTVTMEALTKKDVDVRRDAASHLLSVIEKVRTDKPILVDDYGLLESLQTLMYPVGKTISSVRIGALGTIVDLKETFKTQVGFRMAAEETFPGQLVGMLEYINVHAGTRTFRIYPEVGATHVTCHFPDSLTEEAIGAILQYVEVQGIIGQKKAARYPYAIDVENIHIFPPPEKLPSLNEFRGAIPDLTNGLTSEEYIWSKRGQLE